jgi:predicted transcriptional regulator
MSFQLWSKEAKVTSTEPKTPHVMSLRLPGDLNKELSHYAVDTQRSKTDIIIEAVRRYLKEETGRRD